MRWVHPDDEFSDGVRLDFGKKKRTGPCSPSAPANEEQSWNHGFRTCCICRQYSRDDRTSDDQAKTHPKGRVVGTRVFGRGWKRGSHPVSAEDTKRGRKRLGFDSSPSTIFGSYTGGVSHLVGREACFTPPGVRVPEGRFGRLESRRAWSRRA